jgi:hypothetical protein
MLEMGDLDRHVLECDSNFKAIGKRVTYWTVGPRIPYSLKIELQGGQSPREGPECLEGWMAWICHHFHDKNAHCEGVLVIVCDLGSAAQRPQINCAVSSLLAGET